MDHICWRGVDGRYHAGGCHVPPLATHYETGSVVLEYRMFRLGRTVLCHRDCAAHILYCDYLGRKSWDMDIPEVVRRRWICESRIPLSVLSRLLYSRSPQVESFIPLWEWDLPKKKTKKRKGKESKSSAPNTEKLSANGAYIEEVEDSGEGSSRPHSRNATVEEVPED